MQEERRPQVASLKPGEMCESEVSSFFLFKLLSATSIFIRSNFCAINFLGLA